MIQVYHGSNVAVDNPLVDAGRSSLDFGLGFYVTVIDGKDQIEKTLEEINAQKGTAS